MILFFIENDENRRRKKWLRGTGAMRLFLLNAGGGDTDTGRLAVVVEGGRKATILVEVCIGIPIECAAVVLYIDIKWTMAVVGMIEVGRHIHAVENDAAVAVGIALGVVG